jgi:DNA-binding transcriptional MerR regulator/mannose-6-phosphate isomerase-like protein (cupin superfamily)
MPSRTLPKRHRRPTAAASLGHTAEGGDDSGERPLYIKQASRLVGVSTATIRLWERQGLIQAARTASGYRVYNDADVARLRHIRDRLQVDGLSLAGVRRALLRAGEPVRVETAPGVEGSLGERIRRLRAEQSISLRDLARQTGLSPSFISSVERSLHRPSVASLQKLAAGLGTNLSLMLSEEPADPSKIVVRPAERRRLRLDTPGVEIEQLAAVEHDLEPSIVRVAPGAGSSDSYAHEGEEFIFVLVGELEITLDETETYALAPADAITFRSRRPHRWRNPGRVETTLIWVNTPPTF